ncbi:Txe/YoeB family addiction module toxin [Moorella sp. Hama-1]|uniref:Txe/YoeB family addiction module toxin n=1 Tax=Moorella sp. Hama-1 TaxID=2138101 RepID=UPI000D653745|nr:Txe/YoeB family addiction module toxin [Moorella sp. Hama-1]MDN5362450.1 toxin YoeB [Moorella sp. (in: firmicutes)]BCV21994.1 addiction module protein [Moorella sp. Hama-1]
MGYKLIYTRQAEKDARKLEQAGLDRKAKELLKIIKENPFQTPPSYEGLKGDLKGAYARRINIQHRIVYEVLRDERVVKIIRMWTHYE